MSTWKDPFNTPPEPYSTIWFRRYPEVTPPLQGVWCPNEGTVTLGPDNSWSSWYPRMANAYPLR